MQLDADEDGEPFFKPPAITSSSIQHGEGQQKGSEQQGERHGDSEQYAEEEQNSQAAAGTE